ncbi:CLUMA_CG019821, isoform A [Clunio marinus]|uniref:CLUMA_CG019821, isoform A n=1 Tax=Clunio marinus TaxID=568069 RepID=A0A1J1J7I8_9DIPT|nr:CLUMA_CG019821, isoform A [Clunio marinus]
MCNIFQDILQYLVALGHSIATAFLLSIVDVSTPTDRRSFKLKRVTQIRNVIHILSSEYVSLKRQCFDYNLIKSCHSLTMTKKLDSGSQQIISQHSSYNQRALKQERKTFFIHRVIQIYSRYKSDSNLVEIKLLDIIPGTLC